MRNVSLFAIALSTMALWASAGHAGRQETTKTTGVSEQAGRVLERCIACHGGSAPAAGLNLTTRAGALQGGHTGSALVPGNAAQSLLYKMAASRKMPPDAPLTTAEVEALGRWIEGGANWPARRAPAVVSPARAGLDWWSLQKPKRTALPKVKNASWARNPIDAFVLAALEKKGLAPAPPADKRTLLRRAMFDLLGVPPTPQETAAFLNNTSPNAYEKLIDRLLADPRYGERWGRHWLDVARFGESQGFERDKIRDNAWRYRDYVIAAFNADKPYTRFIQEQIAGDVLNKPTQESIIATGFLVAGPWDEVGAQQASEVMRRRVREEELEDMVSAVTQTFLGMTANCARCHDHKFDPIPQRDYYRLKSALDGVLPGDRSLLTPVQMQARDNELAKVRARISDLEGQIARMEEGVRARLMQARGTPVVASGPRPMARWTFESDTRDEIGMLHALLQGRAFLRQGRLHLNGSASFAMTPPLRRELREKTLEAWLSLASLTQQGGAALTLETIGGGQFDAIVFGEREPGKWMAGSESFRRTRETKVAAEVAKPDELIHVAIVYHADNRIALFRNGRPLAAYTPEGEESMLRAYPADSARLLFGLRHTGAGNGFLNGEIEEARLYDHALSEAEIASSFRAGVNSIPQQAILLALKPEEAAQRTALIEKKKAEEEVLKRLEPLPMVYAANAKQPGVTHVLLRGDVENPGEQVSAGGLSAVRTLAADFGLPPNAPEGPRRQKLADWIASPENPLTARVLVNRVWHYHFGRGLVGSPNDFGFNGEKPTHPALLDWLAATFVAPSEGVQVFRYSGIQGKAGVKHPNARTPQHLNTRIPEYLNTSGCGWSLKKLHRLLMLSNAYRQSGRYSAKAAAVDADNHLLWRFAPQRLEAEAARDAMICVSGQINWKAGGPGFRPFILEINNSHFYHLTDPAEPEYNRRTVYRIVVNSARSPLLDALDCPDPSTKTPRRSVTTTALQALELMNNSFVLRQARCFADRARREAGSDRAAQARLAYALALGRPPTANETQRAVALSQKHGLENLCWALLNASEFLYVR